MMDVGTQSLYPVWSIIKSPKRLSLANLITYLPVPTSLGTKCLDGWRGEEMRWWRRRRKPRGRWRRFVSEVVVQTNYTSKEAVELQDDFTEKECHREIASTYLQVQQ
jgi:hypothetical protein